MNICGVLVHIVPDQADSVTAAIGSIPGAEVHEIQDNGRLIVTVEDTAQTAAIDGLSSIHRLPGVVAAALVYHHFESGHEDTGAHVIMEA